MLKLLNPNGFHSKYFSMAIRILIAEDETLVAELLAKQIRELVPGAEVTAVRTVRELNARFRDNFEISIIDILLADGSSLDWLRHQLASDPNQKFIVLTSREEDFTLHGLMQSSVKGIVHKTDAIEFLGKALRNVIAGGNFYSPKIQELRSRLNANPNSFDKLLSKREQSILVRIGSGDSTAEIAMGLGLCESTVLDHRKNIMKKLDVHSQADLVAYAFHNGFTNSDRVLRR